MIFSHSRSSARRQRREPVPVADRPPWRRTWLRVFLGSFLALAVGQAYLEWLATGTFHFTFGLLARLLLAAILATAATSTTRLNGGGSSFWLDRVIVRARCSTELDGPREGTTPAWGPNARFCAMAWVVAFAAFSLWGVLAISEIALYYASVRGKVVPWSLAFRIWVHLLPFAAVFASVMAGLLAGFCWFLGPLFRWTERARQRRVARTAPRVVPERDEIEICSLRRNRVLSRLVLTGDGKLSLEKGSLRSGNLAGLDLRGGRLAGANMRDALLREADLERADLSGTDLRGADLPQALLRDADLRGADLRGATLIRADFRGADLRGARLRAETPVAVYGSALLYGARLDGATWDETTRWPPGFDPDGHIATFAREVEPAPAPEGEGSELSPHP